LLAAEPGFAVVAWEVDGDLPLARDVYLEALRHDPYNAQLCFDAFCTVWRSQGPQADALQFCRKAIELSPGHGKAHMCAPHAAVPEADMLRHSELGYRLLPGNPFAVNNFLISLRKAGISSDKMMELAEEGIAADPCDPGCYLQMIDLFVKNEEYQAALEIAQRLQKLFEPVMNERALYCLKQNPARARQIESGQYNPAAENRRRIAELRRLVREG
jgi:tetratricopeptide (TPR) repeat protein